MSYPNDRRSRRPPAISTHRGALGYWIPLAVTVTVATIGIAAWIWSERQDDDDEDERPDYSRNPDGSVRTAPPTYDTGLGPGEAGYGTTTRASTEDNQSYMGRISGALRRTPSPQQFLDGASRTVAAGVAAAGTAVGTALSSIREEDRSAYIDHETWSQEVESRRIQEQGNALGGQPDMALVPSNGRRKTVAVVVSADIDHSQGSEIGDHHELAASLLNTRMRYLKLTSYYSPYCPISQRLLISQTHAYLFSYMHLIQGSTLLTIAKIRRTLSALLFRI